MHFARGEAAGYRLDGLERGGNHGKLGTREGPAESSGDGSDRGGSVEGGGGAEQIQGEIEERLGLFLRAEDGGIEAKVGLNHRMWQRECDALAAGSDDRA